MKNMVMGMASPAKLSVEAIQVQKDNTIVRTLTGHFEEIKDTIINKEVVRGKALSNRVIRVNFARIDEAVSKRFGINIKTVEHKEGLLAIQTTPPNAVNVLAGNVPEVHNDIREHLEYYQEQTGQVGSDDIDTRTTNWMQILKTYLRSVDSVERAMGGAGVTVDLENAKIYGYPKDATAIVLINPVTLLKDVGLSPEEMAAAYLHEIGHAFTHIEYSYRAVRNTTTLIDSLLSEVSKNKPPLDVIKLAYAKSFQDDKVDGTTTVPTAVVGVVNAYITQLNEMGGNSYGLKDAERLADQFVSRFGAGAVLGTALARIYEFDNTFISSEIKDFGVILLWMFLISIVVGLFVPYLGMLGFAITGGLIVYALVVVAVALVFYAIFTLLSALFSRGINKGDPYDNPKRRVARLKNDLVRQMRTSKMGKESTNAILSAIDVLERSSSKLSSDTENIVYRTIGKLFSYAGEQNEMRNLDDIMEDLMNNDLHIAANKFKTV